jgi:hypothetical protein
VGNFLSSPHESHRLPTVARRLPMDDPEFINYLRIGYVAAQVIAVGIYYYITLKVGSEGCAFPLTRQIKSKNDLTVLKYVNPPSAMVRLSRDQASLVLTDRTRTQSQSS